MSQANQIKQKFAELERDRAALARIVVERAEGWQKLYVQARQKVALQVEALADSAKELVRLAPNAEREAFSEAATKYAKAVASHQSRWPAILVNSKPEEFGESVNELDQSLNRVKALIGGLK